MTRTLLLLLLPACCLLLPGLAFIPAGRFVHARRYWGAAAAGLLLLALPLAALAPQATSAEAFVFSDPFSRALQMLVLVGGLLFTLASLRTQFESPHQPAYYGSLLLAVGGCALLVTLRDAVFLLLTWELTAVAAAGLLYFASLASESREAAVKHALPGLLASVTLWLGTALLCGLAGTVSVEPTTTHPTTSMSPLLHQVLSVTGLLLVIAGAGWKAAIAPFHAHWADLLRQAPSADAGLLLVLGRIAGAVVATRLVLAVVVADSACISVLVIVAGVTLLVGPATASTEPRVRLLFGSLFVGAAGFALLVLALDLWARGQGASHPAHAGWPQVHTNLWLLLFAQAAAGCGLFCALQYLDTTDRPVEFVEDLRGLVRREPLPAAAISISLLSLVGLPPLAGFWGMWFTLIETVNVRVVTSGSQIPDVHPLFVGIVLVAVASTVLAASACYRVLATVLLDHPLARPRPAGGRAALGSSLFAAAALIAIGVFPQVGLQWLQRGATRPPAVSRDVPRSDLNPPGDSETIQPVPRQFGYLDQATAKEIQP